MIVVRLGDDVATVRSKIGMGEDDFRNAWRSLNHKATELCQCLYGNVPLKGTDTLLGITALKDHYRTQDGGMEGQMAREKIVAALQVSGAGAWIIHNALKRNFEKHKKGISKIKASQPPTGSAPPSSKEAASSVSEDQPARKETFDPIRNVWVAA